MSTPEGPSSNDFQATEEILYEARKKIYARSVDGYFAKMRWAMVWFTQIIFYGLPWLRWDGRQAMLLDLTTRKFYFFGLILWPQDVIFLALLLIISAYGLFLFTAIAGRLFCGYACPQTVYSEIFMWIESKVEGDRLARIRLDNQPMNARKFARKSLKQAIWIAVALWTGFTFVGYFTAIHQLAGAVVTLSLSGWETFWILFYGFATYGNAGYMPEQVCKYMCPYARFQSAMFDHDTLIISYDAERGDPRGTRSRKIDARSQGLGDCIDCGLCVQVCPTGIDIRDGLQYECIGCTACIDVCNGVMDKMKYPRGLIRYATQNGLAKHLTRAQMLRSVARPRVLIYTAILVVITGALLGSIALRSPFRVDVVRDRASLARMVEGGQIENVYRLQVMNATEQPQRYRVAVAGLPSLRVEGHDELQVGPAEAQWLTVEVRLGAQAAVDAGPGVHPIHFEIQRLATEPGATTVDESEKSTFVVPR